MNFRSDDIIFLLGAGASAEAGIPTSSAMIDEIEKSLNGDGDWVEYRDLYNHIKSAIYYAAGLAGQFNEQVLYNIETLVNTLDELERNEQHPLYPFIASWNSRLTALAGSDFSAVRKFRELILDKLKKWMSPDDGDASKYYQGFTRLQQDMNYPLRIFSLNYDLCVEGLQTGDFNIESGFGGYGNNHPWDWERFDRSESGPDSPQVYLYKLHGSINWKRDHENRQLFRVEQTASIDIDSMELIFGRDFKLEAADPYLFYLYAFRDASLAARLLVIIGYGFGDEHINNMLSQALNDDNERQLLVVGNCSNEDERNNLKDQVKQYLSIDHDEQIDTKSGMAKKFLEINDLGDELLKKIPVNPNAPF